MREATEGIVVGLDLGTSKVCTVIGEPGPEGKVNVVGVGEAPSSGLHKGVVVNIEATVRAIAASIAEAERMAGFKVSTLHAGIGGGHVKGFGSRGVVVISQKHQEITAADRDRVMDASKAKVLPADQEILHVLPRGFIVDDQDGIRDPIGMSGVRLECDVHLVTGSVTSIQNVLRSVEKAGYRVAKDGLVLNALATAEVVLNKDEKELGVVLLDIGGGTTDVVVYTESALAHTTVLPVGGNQVTSDLATGLRTPQAEAEELKVKYGNAMVKLVPDDEEIRVAGIGGRAAKTLKRRLVAEIIEPRMEEIFEMAVQELRRQGFENRLSAGVVLTGGGARLTGLVDLADKVFQLPARVGAPSGIGGLGDVVSNPAYSTAVGLMLHAKAQGKAGGAGWSVSPKVKGAWGGFLNWLKENL